VPARFIAARYVEGLHFKPKIDAVKQIAFAEEKLDIGS
jgi:hypothetical protein